MFGYPAQRARCQMKAHAVSVMTQATAFRDSLSTSNQVQEMRFESPHTSGFLIKKEVQALPFSA